MASCLAFKENFDYLQKVPVKLLRRQTLEQLVLAGILYKNFEDEKEFF